MATPSTHPAMLQLKARMQLQQVTQQDIAARTKHSESYISARFKDGRWLLKDCYTILSMLRLEADTLHYYFPNAF